MDEPEKQLAETRRKVKQLKAELREKEWRIADLRRSLSWRVTAPLRVAASAAGVMARLAKSLSNPEKCADAGRNAAETPDIVHAVLNQLIRNPLPARGFESRENAAARSGLGGDPFERKSWSIAMATRGDIFPANHGAAVKIERTAYGLSFLVKSVFLITDEFSRYYVFKDGRVETRFFPGRIRLAGMQSIGWKKKLVALGVPEGVAFLFRPFFDGGFLKRLSYIASRHDIGLFHAEFPAYARPCMEARKRFSGKTLLVEHNVEYDRIRSQWPEIPAGTYQWLKRNEIELCNASDHVVTVSGEDRNRLIADGAAAERISAIPHGVALERYQRDYDFDLRREYGIGAGSPVLVYHGTYGYHPNLEAVRVIAGEILPRLKKRGIRATVIAIGPEPPEAGPDPDIIFTGPVENLAPYLKCANAAVVALLRGGGTRMKILEYFAAGVPVISTSRGIEGIPVTNGVEAIIEDSYDEMAERIIEVLGDPEKSRGMTEHAKAFVAPLDLEGNRETLFGGPGKHRFLNFWMPALRHSVGMGRKLPEGRNSKIKKLFYIVKIIKKSMKKRILVISPVPSHPQNAGNRARICTLLTAFQNQGFEIHYLYYEIDDQCPNVYQKYDLARMESHWDQFFFLSSKVPGVIRMMSRMYLYRMPYSNRVNSNAVYHAEKLINLKNVIRNKIGGRWNKGRATAENGKHHKNNWFDNRNIDDWYNSGIDSFVEKAHRRFKYKAVLAEYVFMSRALLQFNSSVLKIIDTHDVFTERHAKYERAGISERFFSTTMPEEAKGLNRADIVIAIQEQEAEQLRKMTSKPVVTIGHAVRLSKPQIRRSGRNNMLYVGAGNLGNIDGISHFINEVMPLIVNAVPGATLLMAGGICRYVQESPHCRLLGEVDRIEDVYSRADVVINPGVVGTGLKIKTVEALGFGKPAVLTDNALEGLEDARGACLIANEDKEFAQQIIRLLSNKDLYEKLSMKSIEYIKKYNNNINNNIKGIIYK